MATKRAPDLFSRDGFEGFVAGLPAVELVRQWGEASVGKVGGKIFAVLSGAGSEAAGLSFKCSDMAFHLLPQIEGIGPAPYLARAKWVRATPRAALSADEIAAYLVEAHRLVASRLPRRLQAELGLAAPIAPGRDIS
jgi:predicted DNA-binding protein (MmcQ/YjbR family)